MTAWWTATVAGWFAVAYVIVDIIIINKVLIKVIKGALYIVCDWNAVKVQGWQLTVIAPSSHDIAPTYEQAQAELWEGVVVMLRILDLV